MKKTLTISTPQEICEDSEDKVTSESQDEVNEYIYMRMAHSKRLSGYSSKITIQTCKVFKLLSNIIQFLVVPAI